MSDRPPSTATSPNGPRQRRPTKRHWGRRKRRLRRVAWVLLSVAALATALGFWIYRATRPEVRRPGEALPEITEKLSRSLPPGAPTPRFTDVTAEAGLAGFRSFVGDRTSQLPEDMGSGVAWGDYDGDGDDDLFLVSSGGALDLPADQWAASELFENRGDGNFRKVESFPETRISGMAAAWGDYNGDGRLDLVVTGYNALLLFRNAGGQFVRDEALPSPPGYWAGAAWGDFDNDRDLDLYVCGYVQYLADSDKTRSGSEQYGTAVPYTLNPASFEPQRNLLFENRGDGTFAEVAEPFGVSNPGGRSLTGLWRDFDDDGRLDLYVANDISDNALFLNRGETFEDAGLAAWVADYRGAMGLAAGDWNRDGDEDLFVTHWIAQENALYDSRLVDFKRLSQEAPGSTPTRPVQLSFSDLAAPLGVGQIALHSIGWGTEFADFDGDGWLDLVVSNGSTLETGEPPKKLKPQPDMLLWNQQGEYFHDLAPLEESLRQPRVSRGLALSDYDGDGDLDIVKVNLGEGVQLLRNEMQSGNWLELRLRSRVAGSGEPVGYGDGAQVIVHLGGVFLRRAVTSSSYLSQSSRTVHFGLGEARRVDRVEVKWLGGGSDTFTGLEANAFWELTEGDPSPRRLTAGEAATAAQEASAREKVVEFWTAQRAAMDAVKKDGDIPRAVELFRRALALNPEHEDSRYYLAGCLAALGRPEEALHELDELRRRSPSSHRAHKQWGTLRAMGAESKEDLAAAEEALERSLAINREETGALLVLGEVALMQGEDEVADERLALACRTNPRAVGGLFLRGYLAWKSGRVEAARRFLEAAREARGEDWKPAGAVAEGDVEARMHREETPLSSFWEEWSGAVEPSEEIFGSLRRFLANR